MDNFLDLKDVKIQEESIYLKNIVNNISLKNPLHGKKLKGALDGVGKDFHKKAESFFKRYETYALSQGKDLEYGIDSYLKMLSDMMYEYVQFVRTGEYTCKSFEDAYKNVYSNPDVMNYYMHGLLMSQFLWKHHYKVSNFFSDNLRKYTCSSYLEIGGGHGSYLSEAIDIFGKKSKYEMVDISESSLEMAKTFVANKDVVFKLQDIFEYENVAPFDFITMGEVLEHVEQPKELLIALGKLLNDNGTAFITVPTNAPAIDHIYLFRNAQEIEDLIEASGFKVKESISVYSEDVSKEEGARRNIAMLYGAFIEKK